MESNAFCPLCNCVMDFMHSVKIRFEYYYLDMATGEVDNDVGADEDHKYYFECYNHGKFNYSPKEQKFVPFV